MGWGGRKDSRGERSRQEKKKQENKRFQGQNKGRERKKANADLHAPHLTPGDRTPKSRGWLKKNPKQRKRKKLEHIGKKQGVATVGLPKRSSLAEGRREGMKSDKK